MKQEDSKPTNQGQNPDEEIPPNASEGITELTEEDLDQVSGGTVGYILTNKAKAATKSFPPDDIDKYIRG